MTTWLQHKLKFETPWFNGETFLHALLGLLNDIIVTDNILDTIHKKEYDSEPESSP